MFEPVTLLIILVCVLWIVLTAVNLKKAVLLFPFFFPFYLLRFEIQGVPIFLPEMLVIIIGIPVFYLVLRGERKKSNISSLFSWLKFKLFPPNEDKYAVKHFLKSVYAPISLFLIATFVSLILLPQETVYANDQMYNSFIRGLGIMKSWMIFPLIYFVCFRKIAKTKEDKLMALNAYLLSCVFLGGIGLYQLITGDYMTVDARVSGPFESANYLALYIAPAIIYSFIRIYYNFKVNIQYLLSFLFLFGILIFSVSYGGILAISTGLIAYLIYRIVMINRNKVNALFALVIIILIGIGGIGMMYAGQEKFQNLAKVTETEEKSSVSIRLEVWEVAYKLLLANPIKGIGLGRYEAEYIKNAPILLEKEPLEPVRLHSHNLYLETWLNTGIIGVISFLWIIVWLFVAFFKAKNPKSMTMKLGFFMLIVILFHGVIDTTFWKNDLAYLFWLTIALLI